MAKSGVSARALLLLAVGIGLGAHPGSARAAPGSGAATLDPPAPVVAGSYGTWTIDYVATEVFERPGGGVVVFTIPRRLEPAER